MLKSKYHAPDAPAQTDAQDATSTNGHLSGYAHNNGSNGLLNGHLPSETHLKTAPLLWAPSVDEREILGAIINDFDAATRVIPKLEPSTLQNPTARQLFQACRDVWNKGDGEPLRSESLAAYCDWQAFVTELGSENVAWRDCAKIARTELATLPATMNDAAKEAERLALKIKSEAPRRFPLLSIPQLFERPDPEFLIDQWIIQGSTVLFTAKEESFKSFVARGMAACIATGKPWHGFRVKRPGTVVYIAAEGASGIKRRLQAWLSHHDETIAPDRFFVLDMPLQIANDAERRAFIEQIKGMAPALVILDTLARCSVGLEENSASDMGKIADGMGEMARETGAACMIIHHNNRSGEYRGSSALPGNVDTRLSCERRDDVVTLKIEKQKDFEKHKPILLEAQIVRLPDAKGEATSLVLERLETRPCQVGFNDLEQRAFDAFFECYKEESISSAQWKRAASEQKGVPESSFSKGRKGLIDKQAVILVSGKEGGKGKEAATYKIAPDRLPSPSEADCSTLYECSTESVEH